MHDRLDTLKSTFAENDRLLGNFAAERISAIKHGKETIEHYVQSSDEKANFTKQRLSNVSFLAEQFLSSLRENMDFINSAIVDQVTFLITIYNVNFIFVYNFYNIIKRI